MSVSTLVFENTWKMYYYIAIFSTIVFVLKLILFSFFGGDTEVIADFNTEIDTDCSFNFISLQSIIAFFMGFGWAGYASLSQFSFSQILSLVIAVLIGVAFMFGSAMLMFLTKKLEKNVKKDKSTALDKLGKAYTNFEPHSMGQIEVEMDGKLSIVEAKNDTDKHIKSFECIKVINIVDDLLYIDKVEE